jgi:UDP-3-O-[3-hydroxymyristoyl] glucosamine N-acyltransferase
VTIREIARLIGAVVEGGGDPEIVRVAKIDEAGDGDMTFLANPKYARFLASTRAAAVIVGRKTVVEGRPAGATPLSLLRVDDPYVAFVKVLALFHPPHPPVSEGIHPTAVVASTAVLGRDVRLGPCAVVGERCRIGDRTMIAPHAVIGNDAVVGPDCLIYQNVTVRESCRIGARCILQPGAVIGSDGFGFAPCPDGTFEKIPQMGIVVLEDDVEIGANTTVDRATMGETRIKKGVKLDNLIQVAHNVVIGENTVMAAQSGISGSTKLGKNVMVGGQVGFTGHIEIADGVKIGAQSGVHRALTVPGGTFFGSPAFPQREALRIFGSFPQLPDMLATVRDLQKRLTDLEVRLKNASTDSAGRKP